MAVCSSGPGEGLTSVSKGLVMDPAAVFLFTLDSSEHHVLQDSHNSTIMLRLAFFLLTLYTNWLISCKQTFSSEGKSQH